MVRLLEKVKYKRCLLVCQWRHEKLLWPKSKWIAWQRVLSGKTEGRNKVYMAPCHNNLYLWNADEQRDGDGEVLKSLYKVGKALKEWPLDTVLMNGTLLSFKMQIIFPGLKCIGILSLTRRLLHYSSSHCNSMSYIG